MKPLRARVELALRDTVAMGESYLREHAARDRRAPLAITEAATQCGDGEGDRGDIA
jgi:hypothetical protein